MSIKQVEYKGKTILYLDYRGLNTFEEQVKIIEDVSKIVEKSPTPILSLANFEGISVGNEFMTRIKDWGKEYQPKIGRQAVLGISGLKNILFQGYLKFTGDKNTRAFDNETEAMDWLVSS